MSYDYISESDKDIMYSLYRNKGKFTYEGIAQLFEKEYPNINKNIVGEIVRQKYEDNDPIINFDSKLNVGIQFLKTDIQAGRHK